MTIDGGLPPLLAPPVLRTAVLSPDGVYRYRLGRTWDATRVHDLWIMLNPSTADASIDDPTIRRCTGFSRGWGSGGIAVVNLFALRATDPVELGRHPDPIGPANGEAITSAARTAVAEGGRIVCAWGAQPMAVTRGRDVVASLVSVATADRLLALGVTRSGAPKHPLYVRGDTYPAPWRSR